MAAFVGGGTRTAQRLLGASTRCIVHSVRRSPRPTSRIGGVETTPLTAVRHKASAPFDEEYEGLKARRIQGIRPHPDGTTQHILPGNYVIKKNERTGREKRVFLEHAFGYFWAIKELERTDKKPLLSNDDIIPSYEAQTFPKLSGLTNLLDETVDLPDFFTRNNRSKDANAQCTLVALSCKEFGAQLLPSWVDPFSKQLCHGRDSAKFEVVRITLNEGRIAKLLSPFIVSGTKSRIPQPEHGTTLLHYGDADEVKDVLRMHNVYTGYVYLLDGIGRVRWAGSGEGSADEVANLIRIAKELTRPPERAARKKAKASGEHGPRIGKRVGRNGGNAGEK